MGSSEGNADQLEVTERRVKVAEYMKRRIPQGEIARRLGVHDSTISRDVQAIMEVWTDELEGEAVRIRARESQSLDHLEMVAQANMENAMAKRQEIEKTDPKGKNSVAWERYDRAARSWFEERLAIQQRRAKLLNLDVQTPQTQLAVQIPITFIDNRSQAQLPAGEVVEGEVVDDGRE